jgi:VWFA-related protein
MRLLLPILALCAAAQDEPPTFQSSTRVVRVDLQVLEKGRAVPGLAASDFVLTDEGQPQRISFLDRERNPLLLLLALDVSGSMRRYLAEMSAAAETALKVLDARDQVGVLYFAGDAKLALEPSADRRAAAAMLRDALEDRERKAGTVIYGAILDAVKAIDSPTPARRAILVLTDNANLSYGIPEEQVLRELARTNTALTAIVPPGAKPPKRESANPDFTWHNVFKLAQETGGDVLFADRPAERFREALERLRNSYALTYPAPASAPGLFRRIQVTLTPEARRRYPKAEVRARAGYYAAP